MGYHKNKIDKGVLGDFSKIAEEYEELKDAIEQNAKIMVLCELCDLIGAIEAFALNFDVSLNDLIVMKDLTKSAFECGDRK